MNGMMYGNGKRERQTETQTETGRDRQRGRAKGRQRNIERDIERETLYKRPPDEDASLYPGGTC